MEKNKKKEKEKNLGQSVCLPVVTLSDWKESSM